MIQNPGAEQQGATQFDAASWTRIDPGAAYRVPDPLQSHTGDACFLIQRGPTFPSGSVDGHLQQSVSVLAGALHEVTGWAKRTAPGDGGLAVTDALTSLTLAALTPAEATDDWQFFSGQFIAPSGTLLLDLGISGAGGFLTSWQIDDLSLSVVTGAIGMKRELLDTYLAIVAQLRTINGPSGGYYYNVSQSVLTRFLMPGDSGAPIGAYICVPLEDSGPFLESDQQSRMVRAKLRQPIYFFTINTVATQGDDSNAVRVLKAFSDIMRCLMPTDGTRWTLGAPRFVDDVTLVGKQLISEPIDGVAAHPRARVVIDVATRWGRETLGPSAG